MKKILLLLLCMFILSSCIIDNDTIDNTLQNTSDIVQEEIIIEEDIFDDSQLILTIDDYSDEYGTGINSNNFPDKYLRYYVREYYDLDSNNYLSSDEIVNTTDFNSSQDYDYFYRINDFKGLDILANLETICISNSEIIDSFDFSPYKKLEKVTLSGNNITDVDFSNNEKINYLFIKDMLGDSLSLHGCNSKIEIKIENRIINNNDSYILDITDCSYFDNINNIFLCIIDSGIHSGTVRSFKVIRDSNTIVYYNGEPTSIDNDTNDNGTFYINGMYYNGQGINSINNGTAFFDLQEAFEYGITGNTWFKLDDYYQIEKDTCGSCGIPILTSKEGITYASVIIRVVQQPY